MKLFQDSRSTPPEVLKVFDRIDSICRQLASQYNLQTDNAHLKVSIERNEEKGQHRLLVTNTLWALSFVTNKQTVTAHIFPATNLISKSAPESSLNQRLSMRLKNGKILLDDDSEVDHQLDLFALSLFEELVRRSQAEAQTGSKGRVALDGTSVMTAVRNLVNENQNLVAQLLRQNEHIHNHIAADIHDQVLSDLMLLKKLLVKRAADEEETQLLDDAMNYLRDICSGLSGKDLQTFGLMPCLNNLVKKMRRHTEMKIEYEQTGDFPKLQEEVALQIFRIVQEGLNNAVKHADGTLIKVTASGAPDKLTFSVIDDGPGIKRDADNPGLGLTIFVERAAMIQQYCRAIVSVTNNDPHGTKILLEVWLTT